MAKKKVLFVATVDSHIELFHVPYLKMFHDKGWEVHVATDTNRKIQYCDKKICLPIKRSPFKLISNHKAVRELRKIAKKEGYEIVHCHTPMGGVVARLACKGCRRHGTRVIYTAHGFHFYKGAPVHFWLMFYPVEWYLAKYTDTLITINNEDYERALVKFGKRCRDIQYVPGVGVDEKKFAKKMSAKEKLTLRKKLGLKEDDKVLICVGRLDKNKNQGFLIRAMKELMAKDSYYQLLLVGPDELNGRYQKLAEELGVSEHVKFLGFRKDISELIQISDVAVSASKREGLPVNLIEASFAGLPIVAMDCRGVRDIVNQRYLSLSVGEFIDSVDKTTNDLDKAHYYSTLESISCYSLKKVAELVESVYGLTSGGQEGKILLTIGIPVYNSESYIGDLLEKVVEINEPCIETILIDDGSSDRSLEICNKYRNNNIRIYSQDNVGPSKTRNRIIDLSRGDWITFVDSDDLINPNEYCDILKQLSDAFDFYISIATESAYRKCLQKGSDILPMLVESEIINSPCGKIYKKAIIEKNNICFDSAFSLGEDLLFNIQYFKNKSRIKFVNKQLNIIRYNPDSLTRRFKRDKYEELMRINRLCCGYYLDDRKVINSFIYIKIKNCFSCLKDYKKNKGSFNNEYFNKIKNTEIPSRIFLNNIKTTVVYWVWKVVPKRMLASLIVGL